MTADSPSPDQHPRGWRMRPLAFLPPAWRWPLVVLCVVVLSVALPVIRKGPGETAVYTLAGERALNGGEVYRNHDVLPSFSYPPLMLLPSSVLAGIPDWLRRPAWYALGLVCMALGVWVVCRVAVLLDPARGTAACLLAGIGCLRWLVEPIQYQSHDPLLFVLACFGSLLWVRGHWTACAVAAGVGAALKATPLLWVPMFAAQKRWRAVLAALGTIGVLTLSVDAILPAQSGEHRISQWWRSFAGKTALGAAPNVDGAWAAWGPLNQSAVGTLHRWFSSPPVHDPQFIDVSITTLAAPTLRIVNLAVLGGVVLALATACMRREDAPSLRFGQAAAVCAGMLLLSPMTSKQHMGILLVPAAFCFLAWLGQRAHPAVKLLTALAAVASLTTGKDLIGHALGTLLLCAGVPSLVSAALFAATVIQIHHQRGLATSALPVLVSRGRDDCSA